MDDVQINKRFRTDVEPLTQMSSGTSHDLAKWIAENATRLQGIDLSVLIAVGRALYAAEAEQAWRECW
jgi:hypothetical protein